MTRTVVLLALAGLAFFAVHVVCVTPLIFEECTGTSVERFLYVNVVVSTLAFVACVIGTAAVATRDSRHECEWTPLHYHSLLVYFTVLGGSGIWVAYVDGDKTQCAMSVTVTALLSMAYCLAHIAYVGWHLSSLFVPRVQGV